LALSYTVPAKVLGRTVIGKTVKGFSVGISGRNLMTWLPSSNQWTDPEFSSTTSGNGQGVNDIYNTVPTRIFGANISVQF